MASMVDAFSEGFKVGDYIIQRGHQRQALNAAIEEYGDVARDPGLFTAIQNYQNMKGQEQRAWAQEGRLDAQEGRLDAQEGRAQRSFDQGMSEHGQDRERQAVLGLVSGLRQARDRGEDVGAAFDAMTSTLSSLGIPESEYPAMRQAIVDNPAILDDYYATLIGGAPGGSSSTAEKPTGRTPEQEAASRKAAAYLDDMEAAYDALDQLEATPSTAAGGLKERIVRGAKSSFVGQAVARAAGTESAQYYDRIRAAKMMLLVLLKNSNDLGQKMFDSNADREAFLQSLGDPSMPVQGVRQILDQLRTMYELPARRAATGTGNIVGAGDQPISGTGMTGPVAGTSQSAPSGTLPVPPSADAITPEMAELAKRILAAPNPDPEHKKWAEAIRQMTGQ